MISPPSSSALAEVLITEELLGRTARAPILTRQNDAFHGLARTLSDPPDTRLQNILDVALELTEAGSAGISLLETDEEGTELFRWVTMAGRLKNQIGNTSPREFSPCGLTLKLGEPQLFADPARHFDYLRAFELPIHEGLIVPVLSDGQPTGTVWVVSHRDEGHFDMEDRRVMVSLAGFIGFAVKMLQLMKRDPALS